MQDVVSSSGTTPCFACLLAKSTIAILITVVFCLGWDIGLRVQAPRRRPVLFFDSFHLYIRPPPACLA